MIVLLCNKLRPFLFIIAVFLIALSGFSNLSFAAEDSTPTTNNTELNAQGVTVANNAQANNTDSINPPRIELAPSYLPIDKLQFSPRQRINSDHYDVRDQPLAEILIEKIQNIEFWPVGYFQEVRKELTNVIAVNGRAPEERRHSSDFYDYIEAIIVKKITDSGGFIFQECISTCDEKTSVFIGNELLQIERKDGSEDFIKQKTKDNKVDGILKWQFVSQGEHGLLDVRFININNQVIWQETITADPANEFKLEQQTQQASPRRNLIGLALKSQQINFIATNSSQTAQSDFLWTLNYGLRDAIETFDNLRYYVGTRIQINAQALDTFAYPTVGIDTRIGYKLNSQPTDNLIVYGILVQDLSLLTGLSTGLILEWTISNNYSIGLGYEMPITTERSSGDNSNTFQVSDGFWLEISSRL